MDEDDAIQRDAFDFIFKFNQRMIAVLGTVVVEVSEETNISFLPCPCLKRAEIETMIVFHNKATFEHETVHKQ